MRTHSHIYLPVLRGVLQLSYKMEDYITILSQNFMKRLEWSWKTKNNNVIELFCSNVFSLLVKTPSKCNILSDWFTTELFAANVAKSALDYRSVNQGGNTGKFTVQCVALAPYISNIFQYFNHYAGDRRKLPCYASSTKESGSRNTFMLFRKTILLQIYIRCRVI